MTASLFAAAGYFMGDDQMPAAEGNERGFHESREVIRINEELLDQVIPMRPTDPVRWRIYRWRPDRPNQRWVARPRRVHYRLEVSAELQSRMHGQARSPFCLKDPRLCWTLPAWREATGQPALVCVFRHPAETVRSMAKLRQPRLPDHMVRPRRLLRVWRQMYENILRWADAEEERWMFIEYGQMLSDPTVIARLGEFVEAPLNPELADASLRSVSEPGDVPGPCREVYAELRRRAIVNAEPVRLPI
jgi:hypothetical protein